MKVIKILLRKELLDILRDKKTLVIMVAIPVLLYPLLIIGMSLIIHSIMRAPEEAVYTVAYPEAYRELADQLEEVYEKNREDDDGRLEFLPFESEDGAGEISQVQLEPELDDSGNWHVEIHYVSTDSSSEHAMMEVERLLDLYREKLLLENLAQEGLEENFLYPVTYAEQDGASISESFGMDIGGSIGMILIITILMGAMYPAIDATAGERERGTLETLLTLPVTNFQMILSKFLSVSVIACVTAALSILSLGGSVLFLMFGLSADLAGEMQGMSLSAVISAIPILLITLMVTALLATAICMCFCIFAKSFKEANNYITPMLLIVMLASMVGMIPSVTLNYRTVMIPIVNVSLMIKQILSQQFNSTLAGITIAVNFGYSILIVWILAKMYDSENVLFNDGFRSFRLFQKRENISRGTIPDNGDLVVGITVLFLLMLYVGSAANVRLGFWGTAVTQILILAVPMFMTWYLKSDRRSLFSLYKPKWSSIPGSILLYVGTYCIILSLSFVLYKWFPASAENVENVFLPMAEQPLPVLLLVIAVMPAVCEEILFRGLLFGSLKKNLFLAVLLSAFVFGVFHMSLIKFLPTFLLGVAFAYIVQVSGSIYVAMFLHFLNNAASVIILKYPGRASKLVPFLMEAELSAGQAAGLLAVGVVCGGVGLILLRRPGEESPEQKKTP